MLNIQSLWLFRVTDIYKKDKSLICNSLYFILSNNFFRQAANVYVYQWIWHVQKICPNHLPSYYHILGYTTIHLTHARLNHLFSSPVLSLPDFRTSSLSNLTTERWVVSDRWTSTPTWFPPEQPTLWDPSRFSRLRVNLNTRRASSPL